jgi:hypothetical protein
MLTFLRRLVGKTNKIEKEEDWPSIVLLLNKSVEPSERDVLDLATRAWGAAAKEPPKIVGRPRSGSFVLQVDKFFFAFHGANQRYDIEGQETSEAQQRPWDQHIAWLSIDLPEGGRKSKEVWPAAYSLLLVFIRLLWNENCLAMYFPAEGATVPNLGDLVESLRWAGKNGTDLRFLQKQSSPPVPPTT